MQVNSTEHHDGHHAKNMKVKSNEHSHDGHKNNHSHMESDFRKRFWIFLILTIPILILFPFMEVSPFLKVFSMKLNLIPQV